MCKGSGGVAMLIKDSLLNFYGVRLNDNDYEGILGVELKIMKLMILFRYIVVTCHRFTCPTQTLPIALVI